MRKCCCAESALSYAACASVGKTREYFGAVVGAYCEQIMRRVWLPREDFGMFHQDISPYEFEFFRSHAGAFKRMWHEQVRLRVRVRTCARAGQACV